MGVGQSEESMEGALGTNGACYDLPLPSRSVDFVCV